MWGRVLQPEWGFGWVLGCYDGVWMLLLVQLARGLGRCWG